MPAQALYRKWRSQSFADVIGQEHVTHTLKNAIAGGRLVHAYLFAGPRGTGKTSVARILAKAVNCLSTDADKPCNRCAACQSITEGRALDLIEIDAASQTSVEDVRDLRERVNFLPNELKYKVYIIDETHMLSTSAFNALLKTLEEPPAHVIFVLATTEPHRIPATVLSRCQRFDFRRIPLKDIVARVKFIAEQEGLRIEPDAITLIARTATGSLRDAISLLDQLASYGSEAITLEQVQAMLGVMPSQAVSQLAAHLLAGRTAEGLRLINSVIDEGIDPRQFNRQLLDYLRGLLLLRTGGKEFPLEITDEMRAEMVKQAEAFSTPQLVRAIQLFNQAGQSLRGGLQPQLPLELAFVEAMLPAEPEASKHAPSGSGEARTPSNVPTPKRAPRPARPDVPGSSSATGETLPLNSGDLSLVQQRWEAFIATMKQGNRSIAALLHACEPLCIDGEVVTFGVRYAFHKERLEEATTHLAVEKALSQTLDRPHRIKFVLTPRDRASTSPRPAARAEGPAEPTSTRPSPSVEESPPMAPPPSSPTAETEVGEAENDPLIQAAVKTFGAKVVGKQPIPLTKN